MSKILGISELKVALDRFEILTGKGMEIGLNRAGLLLQRASMKVVPIDTNVLRASASTISTGSGFDTEVAVGYGTDYAIYVHENLQAQHKPGKTAKYLEKPLQENRKLMADTVASAIRGSL